MASYSTEISNRIFSDLLAGFATEADRVPASYLLHAEQIPPVVRGFVLRQLEIAVGSDLESLKLHFQLSEAMEESFYHAFFIGLCEASTLSRDDAGRILRSAVDDSIRYLAEPQAFVIKLLSRSNSVVPLDDHFLHAFEYFREYDYLHDILLVWSERKRAEGNTEVSRDGLKALLRKIDQLVVGRFTINELQQLLQPLYSLFAGQSVPKELLIRLFSDKGAQPVAEHLKQDVRTALSLTEVLDLLAILMHQNSEITNEPPPTQDITSKTEADLSYAQFLDELSRAGVVIAPAAGNDLLRSIETRNDQ